MRRCELHPNCDEPVVAKVGLPGPGAIWVCQRGFNEWAPQYAKPVEEDEQQAGRG